jgi:hypothetical protein
MNGPNKLKRLFQASLVLRNTLAYCAHLKVVRCSEYDPGANPIKLYTAVT